MSYEKTLLFMGSSTLQDKQIFQRKLSECNLSLMSLGSQVKHILQICNKSVC